MAGWADAAKTQALEQGKKDLLYESILACGIEELRELLALRDLFLRLRDSNSRPSDL